MFALQGSLEYLLLPPRSSHRQDQPGLHQEAFREAPTTFVLVETWLISFVFYFLGGATRMFAKKPVKSTAAKTLEESFEFPKPLPLEPEPGL